MSREALNSANSQSWQDDQPSIPHIRDHDCFAELMGKLSK